MKLSDILQRYLKSIPESWNYILPSELRKLQETDELDGYQIVDLRKPEDYDKGHIKGAINIFWLDILKPENLKRLDSNKTILVYCYLGHTSSQILVILSLLGFNVKSLKFGIGEPPKAGIPVAGWKTLKYPLYRKRT